jgi:hypothetical protein
MINTNFFKNPDINWKYILIVFFTAFFALVGILNYIAESKKELSFVGYFPVCNGKNNNPVYLNLFEQTQEELILNGINFLEANLDEMEIKLYREGVLEKKVPILTKGDPQGWGGSAVGLYNILDGHKSSFSISEDVYMPYALHYYGKYYLHGEPHYYNGAKLDSPVSGGCLRQTNEDAALIYELSEIDMPVLVIDKMKDKYAYPVEKQAKFPDVSAKSYLVADLDSGYVFAEKNSLDRLPIASLTKLMTAIVLAENVNLRKSVLVKEDMLSAHGSIDHLESDTEYGLVELFYPLLIESSNNAAEVLTCFLGKEKTVELMNEKAKAILMKKTRFVDTSGFDPENVSTARDLFYLARYILNNRQPILDISKSKEVDDFKELNFDVEELWNKNIFINDPTFVGGKTGFIEESKNTAIFIFRLKGEGNVERNIAIILLGSNFDKVDTQRIYIWLQENYFGD